jgi:predicted transcriptional regulator
VSKSIYDDKVVKMLGKSGGMKASTVAAQLGTRASTIYKVLTRLVQAASTKTGSCLR